MNELSETWPTLDPTPTALFLDVDGTVLRETTTYLFVKELKARKILDRSLFFRTIYHGLQHRLGRLDYQRLIDLGLKTLARVPIVELERLAYETFAHHIKPKLYEGLIEHTDDLRRRGTSVVLLSASPEFVIQPIALYLRANDVITTPVRIERGYIVGTGPGPACYGEGKLERARSWAESRGIVMDSAAAYADNWSDRALLEQVGQAAVVRPGRRLRRLALRKGWRIVNPRTPRLPARNAQDAVRLT